MTLTFYYCVIESKHPTVYTSRFLGAHKKKGLSPYSVLAFLGAGPSPLDPTADVVIVRHTETPSINRRSRMREEKSKTYYGRYGIITILIILERGR